MERAALETHPVEDVRLDKWLWAARWFKSRALAARAVAGGKIRVNGERPNKARWIRLGEEVRIRKGPFEFHVVVTRLSGERGPAQEARALYRETAESVQARALLALRLRSQPRVRYTGKGRPTKRDRRAIDRLEQADHDR